MSVSFDELVGTHLFGGIDFGVNPKDQYGETPNVVRFILGDITYEAVEDPDDGYRSSLQDITIVETSVTNRFGPVEVRAEIDGDLLTFTDTTTNLPILSIGTDYSDDYYPSFVSDWHPENMAINR